MKQPSPSSRRKTLPAVAAAGVLGLAASTSADAALYLSYQVSDNFNSSGVVTCLDNAACDADPAAGAMTLIITTPIPGFVIDFWSQFSFKSTGPGGINQLYTFASTVTYDSPNGSPFALAQVAIGDTDYLGPSTDFTTFAQAKLVDADGSVFNLEFFNDPANSQGADTGPLDRPGNLVDDFQHIQSGNAPSGFFHADSGPLAVADGALYGMTLGYTFSLADGGTLDGYTQSIYKETSVAGVPEPGSMLLLGSALCGLVATRRRRPR